MVIPENQVCLMPTRTYGFWTTKDRATALQAYREFYWSLKKPGVFVHVRNFRFVSHVGVLGCACETPDTFGWKADFLTSTLLFRSVAQE